MQKSRIDSKGENSLPSNRGTSSARNLGRELYRASSNITQLRLTKTSLHGRDDEIKLLRGKLHQLVQNGKDTAKKSTANFILVTGKSGTGKSALINKCVGEPASEFGYIFAKGKFDQKLRRPLSAFSDAMTVLCGYLKNNKSAALIFEEIQNQFGKRGIEQLNRSLPGCIDLLQSSVDKRRSSAPVSALSSLTEGGVSFTIGRDDESCLLMGKARRRSTTMIGNEAFSRTQYTIRQLMKIICSHLRGVVLFIDDLQWSDMGTLDLLRSIILDREIPNLLIVGACREFEVADHLPLASYVKDLDLIGVSLTQIHVGNLSADNVKSLVTEALGVDECVYGVEELARIIYEKTEGNPFSVSTFLTSLYDEKILKYNSDMMEWNWDKNIVQSKIVTETVVSVLVNKINRMKEETQMMLMVASCLGSYFHISALAKIVNEMTDRELRASIGSSSSSLETIAEQDTDTFDCYISQDESYSSVASSIVEAEEDGLVEMENNESFNFVHDQIQSAAFDLISPDRRDSFQRKIGNILLKNLPPEELEAKFFDVVGLLNCSSSQIDDLDRTQLAKLNLLAGAKASNHGAFDVARIYYKAGHAALGSMGWEISYSTMLDLCSCGANACYLTGDFETMNQLIEEVWSKYDISATEKHRVAEIKVKSLYAQGKINESIDVVLDFRRQLGFSTLKKKSVSKFIIRKEFLSVQRLLKKMTAKDIAALPELVYERLAMGQRMYELLAVSIGEVEPTMLPLIIFQLVKSTLKHGLNPSSCFAFTGIGALLCGQFGKPHLGCEMARAAELIVEKPRMRRFASSTIFRANCFCYHWTTPLQNSISLLLKGCEEGFAVGDAYSACGCLETRNFHLYFIGRPLDIVQQEIEGTIDVTRQMKQEGALSRSIILLEKVISLRGVDIEAKDTKVDSAVADGNSSLAALISALRLEELVILQEWENALDLVQTAGDVQLALMSTFNMVRYTFLEALTYFKAAHSPSGSKRKKMKKAGIRLMKTIQKWAKNGNVNVSHYLHILQAELSILEGKTAKAEESFKTAISVSKSNGFLQDRALVHELCSAFYRVKGDEYWSKYHVDCTKVCYEEWGCTMKVEQLSSL